MTYNPDINSRAEYPEIKERIGEDPARFLDADLDDEDSAALAAARIRGIRSVDVVQGWIEVEADLDRGPRRDVMAALNQRKSAIEDDVEVTYDEEVAVDGGVSA